VFQLALANVWRKTESSFSITLMVMSFLPYRDGTLFDLLMAETKPEYVHIEMDVYWIVNPGRIR
jgi:hypothetical protein